MDSMSKDPTFVSKFVETDLADLFEGWSDFERSTALAEFNRVIQFIGGFGEVFVVHPSWRTAAKITPWGRELKVWAVEMIKRQPWAGFVNVPKGDLWYFQEWILHNLYEIWYKGERIPENWE